MNDKISDELLAAYLDGNTSPIENLFIESNLGNDASIMDTSDILSDMTVFSQIGNYNEFMSEIGLEDIISHPITIETKKFNENNDNNVIMPDIQQQNQHICAIKTQQIILN